MALIIFPRVDTAGADDHYGFLQRGDGDQGTKVHITGAEGIGSREVVVDGNS